MERTVFNFEFDLILSPPTVSPITNRQVQRYGTKPKARLMPLLVQSVRAARWLEPHATSKNKTKTFRLC